LVLHQALHSFDEISPIYLGGSSGICLSINVSHNFANSSHYNSVDYGPSIVLWIMDDVAAIRCDQYLVFNNIKQIIDDKTIKKGVMIKLSNGMIMSFQGSTLRHGTTIHHDSASGKLCPPGNIYGIHFGLSMPTLTHFHHIQIDQYIREMCIIPKMIIGNYNNQNHVLNYKTTNQKRVNKNQIQFPKQKMKRIDEVVKIISNSVTMENNSFDTTMKTENEYHTQITSESNKQILVLSKQGQTR